MEAGGFSMSAQGDVTTFSFPHFKFVAKEVTERLKVCSSASSYMDDLAELENALGKALVKVGIGGSEHLKNIKRSLLTV